MKTSLSATHRLPIDLFPRVQAVCFDSLPQARHWLDDLISGEEFSIINDTLCLASGIKVRSMHLDQILATKDRASIEDRYHAQNRQFRRGPWDVAPSERSDSDEPAIDRAPKVERVKRPERPPNFITVSDIAKQLKVKPFDVRQALRNSGAIKPDYGWAFDPTEVKAIKKLMEKS